MEKGWLRRYIGFLTKWRVAGNHRDPLSAEAPPLRAELFGMLQLESHAREIATRHAIDPTQGSERLLRRLAQNEEVIHESYRIVVDATRHKRNVAPAAEWLLDNYYLIKEQIRMAQLHFPKSYSRQLPRLQTGDNQGLPRVYDLILQLVAHTDGCVDVENLSRFVAAYQSVKALSFGELWAVPIMLRLTLIENLRRVAYRIVWRRRLRDQASEWAQRFLRSAHDDPKHFIMKLADFVRSDPPQSGPFVAELVTSLEGHDPSMGLVINWLEQQFASRGQTLELVHQAENHEQAADQASITNTITSLRWMDRIDWKEFIEALSVTDAILHHDPSDVYARMDFVTRDRYRHIVEHLAKISRQKEEEVAKVAVRLAKQKSGNRPACDHVGYYLVGDGIDDLKRKIGIRPGFTGNIVRWLRKHATGMYLTSIAVLTACLTVPFAFFAFMADGLQGWMLYTVIAMLVVVLSCPAIRFIQWLCGLIVWPRNMSRFDFSHGIPQEHMTAVVVPTLLTAANVRNLLENIEVHFLANRSSHLLFGLLTDFPDADQVTLPGEEELLRTAVKGIRELNTRYADKSGPIFFLLHRSRLWNASERVWMGYERKRGKLEQFNKLVRLGDTAPFKIVEVDMRTLREVRYVITLDTDTQLPPGSIWRMVGTMAHPLNRPRLDTTKRRVVEGYAILQPRLAVSLQAAQRSTFSAVFAGEVGLDPYTREVSNIYYDLFGQSQYVGKGIYDVEAVDAVLADRFPENRILSHDLIEGCYARCGFINDVELLEEHPATYIADAYRRHRWIRGDWQIARWLCSGVPSRTHRSVSNSLSLLSRWMVFDNLRRSLVPFAMVLALGFGWVLFPRDAIYWTFSMLGIFVLPEVARTLRNLVPKTHSIAWTAHIRHVLRTEARAWCVTLFEIINMPYEACMHMDAILRTLWRLWITRRGLLCWRTAAEQESASYRNLFGTLMVMGAAPVFAVGTVTMVYIIPGYSDFSVVAFMSLMWFCSPFLMWFFSRSVVRHVIRLPERDENLVGTFAFRTWMYFERFSESEHNWLTPDNIQETEGELMITHRTSPTNIAMELLSGFAAYDLGYIPVGKVLERTSRSFSTLEKMERYHGHLYNWYDTQSLQPLRPRYVSTVDSGNLIAALITLRSGLLELAKARCLSARWRKGFAEMVEIARAENAAKSPGAERLVEDLGALRKSFIKSSDTATGIHGALIKAHETLGRMKLAVQNDEPVRYWLEVIERHVENALQEILYFAPWLSDKDLIRQISDCSEKELTVLFTRVSAASLADLAKAEMFWGADLDVFIRRAGLEPDAARRLKGNMIIASKRAAERLDLIRELTARCEEITDMDMKFLYNQDVKLFRIGFNADTYEPDPACYDLLASESRLSSYVAVASRMVPLEHWFHLGRSLAPGGSAPVLQSWSGSMFEYLMPELFMPVFTGTLLGESARNAVTRQIAYARTRRIPWGISESGYNQKDVQMMYQYRAFGVPSLGLKRGLSDDQVVAPYATALALMFEPVKAVANMRVLARAGAVGRFGFYEALDYTPERVPNNERMAIVRSHMAHHSGMSLLAFANVLCNRSMQRRFRADPEIRANKLLLQERIPPAITSLTPEAVQTPETRRSVQSSEPLSRQIESVNTPIPEVHLLSNGRYHVMMTNAGGGYSRWQDLALTRWREDSTRDAWGTFFYLRDADSNDIWGVTSQPTGGEFKRYVVNYSQGEASFFAVRNQIQTLLRIAVSPEDDLELRRLTLKNLSKTTRTLDVTSYAEVVLFPQSSEAAHPALQGLFVEAKMISEKSAICFLRRRRSSSENWPGLFNLFLRRGDNSTMPTFETSRERFIGRGNTTAHPMGMLAGGDLANTGGVPLDPVSVIRHRVVLAPDETVTLDSIMGVGQTPEDVHLLVDKYQDSRLAGRVFDLTWTHSQVLMHQLKASEADAQLYGHLAGSLLFANRRYRANPSLIARNRKGQAALWSYAVSGDRPILLLRISDVANLKLVRRMLQAHSYWRYKGLGVDMIIWAEAYAGYRQSLLDAILGIIHAGVEAKELDQPGGIFVRNSEQVAEEDRVLIQASARVIISDRGGTLESQLDRQRRVVPFPSQLKPARKPQVVPEEARPMPRKLLLPNGIGGFTEDGREYVIVLKPGMATPAPWVNVLANPLGFGSVMTESGGSYTWPENAHEFRLTPWYNDPVSDISGEAFYIRDEETGAFWSPSLKPATGSTPYVCRHGLGYSAYEHTEGKLFSEMQVFVASDVPVKCSIISLRNISDQPRRVSVTGFCEWVLGEQRGQQAMHVVTRLDAQTGAVFATNAFNPDFQDRVAFFQCSEVDRTLTGDRTEFLGRNGDPAAPAAMLRKGLSNNVGAGLDPCAAIQAYVEIPPNEERRLVFVLGCARNDDEARGLLRRFSGYDGARQALEGSWQFWKHQLGGVYIETPDSSLNFLVNHWLLYQVLTARFWGRSGFYQSGGAYGFRDQLQDSLAFLYECPWLTRQHLLLCASRQFKQGDAQHWWHVPSGRGVRTRISDTALWLPYVTSRYIEITGDTGVLDESVTFMEGRKLRPDEESYYDLAGVSEEKVALYEHCVRAIRNSFQTGDHGLPLMGSGDWNDGMNRVGNGGKGESVWLAFFLHDILNRFAKVAEQRGDEKFTRECRQKMSALKPAIENGAWDGKWYRRAYFDDGTPLGSAQNDECRIDALPQSWAVLSGTGDPERCAQALRAAREHLVDERLRLIRIFTPPFDNGRNDPGYIRAYVPGVRENGGQYTHAAIWLAMAFAKEKDAAAAWQLCSFLNPIRHGDSVESVARYRVEPYVIAADVYTNEAHEGRGGWTWYTGSASWMYQLMVENLLGLRVNVDKLTVEPLFHPDWKEYKMHYRYRDTFYHIHVRKTGPDANARKLFMDGVEQPDKFIRMVNDGREKNIVVEVG
ncbi:GH36-type glycosyl hydrolase domain-containing protein [Verrucomicrobiota bacterium]